MSEHDEQAALIQWAQLATGAVPALRLLHAIPNGGQRHPAVAQRLQNEGVKAGVPDLFLPVANGDMHGLYIEMKYGRNRLTPAQVEWKSALEAQGYRHVTCYSWVDAARQILDYLCLAERDKARLLGG